MKHYVELLGLFAVSGCLALILNGVAHAHPQPHSGSFGNLVKTELRATTPPTLKTVRVSKALRSH